MCSRRVSPWILPRSSLWLPSDISGNPTRSLASWCKTPCSLTPRKWASSLPLTFCSRSDSSSNMGLYQVSCLRGPTELLILRGALREDPLVARHCSVCSPSAADLSCACPEPIRQPVGALGEASLCETHTAAAMAGQVATEAWGLGLREALWALALQRP